jgi:hypothetical protein
MVFEVRRGERASITARTGWARCDAGTSFGALH